MRPSAKETPSIRGRRTSKALGLWLALGQVRETLRSFNPKHTVPAPSPALFHSLLSERTRNRKTLQGKCQPQRPQIVLSVPCGPREKEHSVCFLPRRVPHPPAYPHRHRPCVHQLFPPPKLFLTFNLPLKVTQEPHQKALNNGINPHPKLCTGLARGWGLPLDLPTQQLCPSRCPVSQGPSLGGMRPVPLGKPALRDGRGGGGSHDLQRLGAHTVL